MRKHCFTLVEILTALIIVGILAGMGLGIASYAQNKGKEMRTQATLKLIEQALEQYKRRFGDYPVLDYSTGVNANIGVPIFVLPDASLHSQNLVGCFTGVDLDTSGATTAVRSIAGMGNIGTNNGHYVILDGWDQPIIYIYPGVFNTTKYDLGSFGPDRRLGDGGVTFTVNGDTYAITASPSFGTRTSGDYRSHFGEGDDMTNFKR